MARPGRAAELDERAAARGRLQAMWHKVDRAAGSGAAGGWVPEPPEGDQPVRESNRAGRPIPVAPAVVAVDVAAQPPTIGDLAMAWAMDRLPPWAGDAIERVRLRGLVMVAGGVLVAVVVGAVLLVHHSGSNGYSSSYEPASAGSGSHSAVAAPVPTDSGAEATSIVVDVGGRVRKPGLVTLPAGARVADAIAAAGGPLHHKEIATVDLAARVSDGQLLLIGVPDPAADAGGAEQGTGSSPGAPAAPVDLDSATLEELETLPGVGPVTAQKIIDWRSAHSGFTTVAQLQQVPGIGPAKFAEISPLVTP